MTTDSFVYGDADGDPFEMARFDGASARRHGLIFTDDSPNGVHAYRDLCEIIEHEALQNDIEVFILDPHGKFEFFSHTAPVDTHDISFETLGNPVEFAFAEGFTDSKSVGIRNIQSLLLSMFGLQGFELSREQQELFYHLVHQAYTNCEAPCSPLDLLFDDIPTLAELTSELVPLCTASSQPVLNDFATYLQAFQCGGQYEATGDLSGELTTSSKSITRYTNPDISSNIHPSIIYHTLLNCVMNEAHSSDNDTWVVLGDYTYLLLDGASQQSVRETLSVASGAYTSYEFIVENLTDYTNLPPMQQWYNQGRYTRFYTTDAPPSLGTAPSNYAEWLDTDSQNNTSQSVLALSEHAEGPHRLENSLHTPKSSN